MIVEGVYTGTHTGPLAGPAGVIPATGRSFSLPYVDIFQARDGKFVSHRCTGTTPRSWPSSASCPPRSAPA